MAIPKPLPFSYEIELSGQKSTIKCHGKVVSETAGELKELVKPLIPKCRHIVLDLTDVVHVDSSGLGTLVGLKISAVAAAYCSLEFINLSSRVQELLQVTKLTQLFKPSTTGSRTQAADEIEGAPEPLSVVAEEVEAEVATAAQPPAAAEVEEPESLSVVAEEVEVEQSEQEVATAAQPLAAAESRKSATSKKTAEKAAKKSVKKAAKKPAKKSAKKKTGKKGTR